MRAWLLAVAAVVLATVLPLGATASALPCASTCVELGDPGGPSPDDRPALREKSPVGLAAAREPRLELPGSPESPGLLPIGFAWAVARADGAGVGVEAACREWARTAFRRSPRWARAPPHYG